MTFPRSHSSVEDHKLLKDRYYLTVVITIIILVSGGAELRGRVGLAESKNEKLFIYLFILIGG